VDHTEGDVHGDMRAGDGEQAHCGAGLEDSEPHERLGLLLEQVQALRGMVVRPSDPGGLDDTMHRAQHGAAPGREAGVTSGASASPGPTLQKRGLPAQHPWKCRVSSTSRIAYPFQLGRRSPRALEYAAIRKPEPERGGPPATADG
jgi:hypothetical protein